MFRWYKIERDVGVATNLVCIIHVRILTRTTSHNAFMFMVHNAYWLITHRAISFLKLKFTKKKTIGEIKKKNYMKLLTGRYCLF